MLVIANEKIIVIKLDNRQIGVCRKPDTKEINVEDPKLARLNCGIMLHHVLQSSVKYHYLVQCLCDKKCGNSGFNTMSNFYKTRNEQKK